MASLYETVTIERVCGLQCDICGRKSTVDECGRTNLEFGLLRADWGYFSGKDGLTEQCDICEHCFDKITSFIRSMGGNVQETQQEW